MTREEAWQRWEVFSPALNAYANMRNHVLPGHPHVSRMSPALRFRVVLEREIIAAARLNSSPETVEKFVQEVYWRLYWKAWLEVHPGVWENYRERVSTIRDELHSDVLQRVAEVEAGKSGVAIMDYFVKELAHTGYMHNHARMWFASFWIHVERLPWELGADFFFRHLLDADAASNTLSWRWVAGIQTKDKPYLVKRSNIEKFCAPELLSDGRGLERLNDDCVAAAEVVDTSDPSPRPVPILPEFPQKLPERYGIWLHSDDLCVEHSPLAWLKPVSVAGLMSRTLARVFSLSQLREMSVATAIRDGTLRASQHYGCPAHIKRCSSLVEGLIDWATRWNLQAIVTISPHNGVVHHSLKSVAEALRSHNITLCLVKRSADVRLCSSAHKGFNDFWTRTKPQGF